MSLNGLCSGFLTQLEEYYTMTNPLVNLVQTQGQQAFTTSLIIAEEYGKAHDKVLRSIRAMLNHTDAEIKKFAFANFGDISYIDAMNRPQAAYRITEDGFLELAMSFTGDKARKTRIRFIEAFRQALNEIARLYADPPRTGLITDKRKSHWDMTDALKEIRAENGKNTEAHHYANENKLINWCIKGKFAALNEKSLSNEEMEICKKLRVKNAAFIRADMEYAERKVKLKEYAARLQNIKLLQA